ncbi:MAG: Ig-like domain-containing protein [Solirubrobacterales bacterium]
MQNRARRKFGAVLVILAFMTGLFPGVGSFQPVSALGAETVSEAAYEAPAATGTDSGSAVPDEGTATTQDTIIPIIPDSGSSSTGDTVLPGTQGSSTTQDTVGVAGTTQNTVVVIDPAAGTTQDTVTATTDDTVVIGPENHALNKVVTASTKITNAARVTDGDLTTTNYAQIDPGVQWVKIDLGQRHNISEIKLWHYFQGTRTYHDVIVQVSNDPDFRSTVTTLFNNDTDDTAGQGKGQDEEYVENETGKSIAGTRVNARYVRLWTNGSTYNTYNHLVEVQVFGDDYLPENHALNAVVYSSVKITNPVRIIDGDTTSANFAQLEPGAQWVRLDLGQTHTINEIDLWHYYSSTRTYHDVIVQVSDDPEFLTGVTTVFNNDADNSAGQSNGLDAEYTEKSTGKVIGVANVNARYVRVWSNGNTYNAYNHLVEIMVFGSHYVAPIAVNHALNAPATGSAAISNAARITDGDTNCANFAQQTSGLQYVQIDLGHQHAVSEIKVWRYYIGTRSYHDVIVQLSNDPGFAAGVEMVFNNDTDGSAGLGTGLDAEYVEKSTGMTFNAAGKKGRYLRLYSNGNTYNAYNHLVEVQVFGEDYTAPVPVNHALKAVVTGSVAITNASRITDGDLTNTKYAQLPAGLQWVQVDLGSSHKISEIKLWHYYSGTRIYKDVILQVSNDPAFKNRVFTIFNNDKDESAGGAYRVADVEYAETKDGKSFPVDNINARYVRAYSNGNNANGYNHIVEIQIFGQDCAPMPEQVNMALNAPVSSQITLDMPELLTDGVTSGEGAQPDMNGPQWYMVDLSASQVINEIKIWHDIWTTLDPLYYYGVVVQVSDNPNFPNHEGIVYSNDKTNLSGQGAVDFDGYYAETPDGLSIAVNGKKARYVRVWGAGSSEGITGRLVEIQAFGDLGSVVPPDGNRVTGVSLNQSQLKLTMGTSERLIAAIQPTNADNKAVYWTSSKPDVATVDATGLVQAIGTGSTLITVTTLDGYKMATCFVQVIIPVTSVELSLSAPEVLAGQTVQATYKLYPENATDLGYIISTANPGIAKSIGNGLIQGVAPGTTTVTLTAQGSTQPAATAQLTVKPNGIPATGITLNKYNIDLKPPQTYQLVATIQPADATNKEINWTSNNPAIATVDANGLVTAVTKGQATIVAATKDGSLAAACVARVTIPITSVEITLSASEMTVGQVVYAAYKIIPENASETGVVGNTTNMNIAKAIGWTPDWQLIIKGISPGTTDVTFTPYGWSSPGGTAKIVVKPAVIPVSGITLDKTEPMTMTLGDTTRLLATVLPASATNQTVTWSSSNDQAVTVDSTGLVTAIGSGTATITATTADGGYSASCTITTSIPVTDVIITLAGLQVHGYDVSKRLDEITKIWVFPDQATNKSLVWSSDNAAVVTVSQDGVITTHGAGEAIVTATAADGSGAFDTLPITVTAPVTGVSLNEKAIVLEKGKTSQLIATVQPDNAIDKTVYWTSTNTLVVTVLDGLVTAVGPGTATITVTTQDRGFTAECAVTVVIPVTSVSLDQTTLKMPVGGTPVTLKATIDPVDATNQNVTWSSSNTNVAAVNDGVVTAVGPGTATITVKTGDGEKTAECIVTAVIPVTAVSLDKTELTLLPDSAPVTLKATMDPANATEPGVTWSSSSDNVASVIDGVVTAKAAGSAVITVSTVDGSYTAQCKVTVMAVSLDKTSAFLKANDMLTLTATVVPEDAVNKAVTWNSSAPEVAMVDNEGKVTAIAPGITTITVETIEGKAKAECTITVVSVSLDKANTELEVKQSLKLEAAILPAEAANMELIWSSSDDKIASVDVSGTVTGLKAGTATITVKTKQGEAIATCVVTVTDHTPPVLLASSGSGTIINLNFDEDLNASKPNTSSFTVTARNNRKFIKTRPIIVKSVAVNGNVVTLALLTPIQPDDQVTVKYNEPKHNKQVPIQDLNGNKAASFTEVLDQISDEVSVLRGYATGNHLDLNFNQRLDSSSTPAASSFTVMVNGKPAEVRKVMVLGTDVVLFVKKAAKKGESITVSYVPPVKNPLRTSIGKTLVPGMNGLQVENKTIGFLWF